MNQKRGGQDTPLKSQKLREAIALSIDKKNLSNVILNDGSKPADFLVPKGLATGPDGKDFQETFKTVLNQMQKAAAAWDEAKKNLEKTKLQLSY